MDARVSDVRPSLFIRTAPDGRVWMSELHGNRIVSYDPATSRSRAYDMPTPHSGPRRFDVDARGVLWIPAYAANALVRFDPVSETYESFPSDRSNAAVRQMLGRDGEAWGAESGTDRLVVVEY